MSAFRLFLMIAVLAISFLQGCTDADVAQQDAVALCEPPVPRELQDARFTVIFKFDLDGKGKPIHIIKVENSLLPDEPFAKCIAEWSLPSLGNKTAVAYFVRVPSEGGWTEMTIADASGVGQGRTYRYHPR